MTKLTSKTILGEITPSVWAHVFESNNLVLAAEIVGKGAAKEGAAFSASFDKKLKKIAPKNLADFKEVLSPLIKKHPDVSFVATIISDNRIYVVISGDGAAFLARAGELQPLLTHSGSASSEIQNADTLLLLTEQCSRQVPDAFLKEVIISPSLTAMHELFSTTQRSRNAHSYGAAVLMAIDAVAPVAQVVLKPITSKDRIEHTVTTQLQAFSSFLYGRRLILMVLIAAVICSSAGYRWYGKLQQQASHDLAFKNQLQVVETLFKEGIATVATNPLRGRALIMDAKMQLEAQLATTSSEVYKKQIGMVLSAVDQGLQDSKRVYESPLTTFYDLQLIKPGAIGLQWDLYQDTFVIADIHHELLYRVSASTKAAKILAHSDILRASRGVSVLGEDIYVFTDTLHKLNFTDGTFTPIFPRDEKWANITAFKFYENNAYLLDTNKNWVWKYFQNDTGDGFGTLQDYFVFDTLVDLTGADDLAVDGYVWIVKQGAIKRFSQGKEDVWRVVGLEKPFGNRLNIFADASTEQLYVLDNDNSRVVQLSKNGEYLSQYVWRENAAITDFAVSEPLRKIFLLAGATIYSIDLK